jgi:hypothetical protein
MLGSLLDNKKVQKLVFFSEEAWLTLDRDINSQNYKYCGSMKISMQFIKFLHKYLNQWGKRGKLVLITVISCILCTSSCGKAAACTSTQADSGCRLRCNNERYKLLDGPDTVKYIKF